MRRQLYASAPSLLARVSLLSILTVSLVFAQVSAPDAGLQFVTQITVPNWTTTGATQASFDTFSFNPLTRIMYFGDRVNHGATAIDTVSNKYLGTIQPPGCDKISGCASGVLVLPDLQKLVVTDRGSMVFVYDLRVPLPTGPVALPLPSGKAPDELDYDPINHRVYIGNTTAPYFVTVVDAVAGTILGQIPLATSPEQPRFNPVDGLVYVNSGDGHIMYVVDPNQGAFGTVIQYIPFPNCALRSIDIDPVSDIAMLGCTGTDPFVLFDVRGQSVLQTFPQTTGNDLAGFSPNNRRWYMGAGGNRNSGVNGCPAAFSTTPATAPTPVIGVFSAASVVSGQVSGPGSLVGVTCSGRSSSQLGADPVQNNVYVAARQYPADPGFASTGKPGVLVLHDPAPFSVQVTDRGSANVTAAGSGAAKGTVSFQARRRAMTVSASLTGLASGSTNSLVITTSVGHEVVPCTSGSGGAYSCSGNVLGNPLVGGVVDVSSNGTLAGQGNISLPLVF